MLNFYLLIIKQERITVYDMYLANPKKQVLDPQVEHQIAIQLINSLVVLMHFISEKHY